MTNLADGLFLMAVPLIAVTVTSSPALIAGLRVAQTLPWFLFGLFVGVLVDRVDRRRLMLAAETLRGVALLGIAVTAAVTGLNLPLLYVAALLVGVAETVSETAAHALVPMVVEPERLPRANGRLFGTQMVMNDFVGAPVGALLVAAGTVVAVFAPAGLYLAAAGVLLTVRGRYAVVRTTRTSVLADVREGIGTLVRNRTIARLTVYAVVTNLVNTAFFAVFVVFAVGSGSALGLSGFGYSVLIIVAAVGAVSGAAAAGRLAERVPPRHLLTGAVLALAICFVTPFAVPNAVAVGAALLLSGFATAVSAVVNTSLRQSLVPSRLLGRVSAGFRFLAFGARPVGALAGGIVAQALTPGRLFAVLAVVVLSLVPLTIRLRPESAAQAGRPTPGEPAGPVESALPVEPAAPVARAGSAGPTLPPSGTGGDHER
ncbi:MFS transporter [Micromonospora sp. KC606]|nr:MFS transporter [Micromonospora sp. KC606]